MPTLIQRLPEEIKVLEAKHGSDNPYVKQLKEQLRAMKANKGQSTQHVYQLQAVKFSPTLNSASSELPDLQNLPVDPVLAPMQQRVDKSQA